MKRDTVEKMKPNPAIFCEDSEPEPAKRGRPVTLTVNALSRKTGIDRRTVHKRLVAAGLYPPEQFESAKVLEAIRPPPVTAASGTKEKKTHEEWRKLKIANDAKDATLTDTAWICERIQTAVGKWRGVVQQKFVNEAPERVAMQDVAGVREILRKIADETDLEIAALAELFGGDK